MCDMVMFFGTYPALMIFSVMVESKLCEWVLEHSKSLILFCNISLPQQLLYFLVHNRVHLVHKLPLNFIYTYTLFPEWCLLIIILFPSGYLITSSVFWCYIHWVIFQLNYFHLCARLTMYKSKSKNKAGRGKPTTHIFCIELRNYICHKITLCSDAVSCIRLG